MCGIFGTIGYIKNIELLNECVDRLSHRGPDGKGTWDSGDAFLGHRRLSIIDLTSNGTQPMEYDNGRYHITFNGEIYNYIEIKKELITKGYKFISDSDTEVILASYSCWGKKCINKFNGMWAFAIFDSLNNELFLSRDRFGIKPLYYLDNNKTFAFSSEMKALMPLIDNPEINHPLIKFYQYFYHYEFREECLVKQIKRFPAGHNALYKDGKLTIERWWNTLDNLIEVPSNYSDRVEMFRELFIDSCRIRMRSDVSIGTALSGGLDSSAVICAMNSIAKNSIDVNYNKDWQHAYVAGFAGSSLDETYYAKKVTDYINIDSTVLNIENFVDESLLYKQAYLFEDLWMNSQIPMMEIYRKERERGTVVSLDGHGADELFGGYSFDMKYSILDATSEKEILGLCQTIFDADSMVKVQEEFDKIAGRYIRRTKLKTNVKSIYDSFYRKTIVKSKDEYMKQFRGLSEFDKTLYMQTHQKVLPTLLRNYDRDSMASGVEIRMPFMDYRIVSFAFSIPWQDKIHSGYSKAIIRDAMGNIMPQEVVERKGKIGFNAPMNEWLRKDKEVYLDIINSQDFVNSEVATNPNKTKKQIMDAIQNKKVNPVDDTLASQKAWHCINLFCWEKGFFKENGKN